MNTCVTHLIPGSCRHQGRGGFSAGASVLFSPLVALLSGLAQVLNVLDLIGGLLLRGKHQLSKSPGSTAADAPGRSLQKPLEQKSGNQHQHALTIIINCCSNAFFIWYKIVVITNPLACKTEMTMIPSYIVESKQCSPTYSPLPWSGPGGHKTKDLFPTKRGKCLKYLFTISPERDFLHK